MLQAAILNMHQASSKFDSELSKFIVCSPLQNSVVSWLTVLLYCKMCELLMDNILSKAAVYYICTSSYPTLFFRPLLVSFEVREVLTQSNMYTAQPLS